MLDRVLEIANKAKNYARAQIRKGSTQLENNQLDDEHKEALETEVGRTRYGIRAVIDEKNTFDILEPDKNIAHYENTILVTSKYSLGNCFELALQALDYVLIHEEKITAEVYKIRGGDHIFLVLNRAPGSDPSNPATWGQHAVICDPWSDKVYKASDYRLELKNFHYIDSFNYTEDFNPSRHKLIPYEKFNTAYLKKNRTVDNLKKNFIDACDDLISILEKHKDILEQSITIQYLYNKKMVILINNKISAIAKFIKNIEKTRAELFSSLDTDYRLAKEQLYTELDKLYESAADIVQFSQQEIDQVFKPTALLTSLFSCRKSKINYTHEDFQHVKKLNYLTQSATRSLAFESQYRFYR
jgi:hypothetical protein